MRVADIAFRAVLVLLQLVALVSCTEPARVPASADAVTTPSSPSRQEPLVLIATSAARCEDGKQVDISRELAEDDSALRAAFPHAKTLDLVKLPPLDASLSASQRGMVVVYSGHATVVRTAEREVTHLCLGGRHLSTDELFEWVRSQAPKWATVILNGCETAQVNPAVVSSLPISVISASPTVMTPSSLANTVGTDFVRALVSVIAEAREHVEPLDANCDGTLSDQELFYPLEARLRRLGWMRRDPSTAIPVPKLRRNADVPLPVLYLASTCASRVEPGVRFLPELANVIERERETVAAGRLPRVYGRYFILNGVKDHDACLRGAANGSLASVCKQLRSELEPVGLQGTEFSDADLRTAATALAKQAVATEVYWLRLEHGWAELHRLRDETIVGVSRSEMIQELLPQEPRRILSGRLTGNTWRYSGKVWWPVLAAKAAVPEVCRAPEGQCFRVPPPPAMASAGEAKP
jgi:hypothetical protein